MYHYLVMPYFKQGTLRQRISKEILTEEEAGKILDQVSSALQVAHDHGISIVISNLQIFYLTMKMISMSILLILAWLKQCLLGAISRKQDA